jgi:hypothetical protein
MFASASGATDLDMRMGYGTGARSDNGKTLGRTSPRQRRNSALESFDGYIVLLHWEIRRRFHAMMPCSHLENKC